MGMDSPSRAMTNSFCDSTHDVPSSERVPVIHLLAEIRLCAGNGRYPLLMTPQAPYRAGYTSQVTICHTSASAPVAHITPYAKTPFFFPPCFSDNPTHGGTSALFRVPYRTSRRFPYRATHSSTAGKCNRTPSTSKAARSDIQTQARCTNPRRRYCCN